MTSTGDLRLTGCLGIALRLRLRRLRLIAPTIPGGIPIDFTAFLDLQECDQGLEAVLTLDGVVHLVADDLALKVDTRT